MNMNPFMQNPMYRLFRKKSIRLLLVFTQTLFFACSSDYEAELLIPVRFEKIASELIITGPRPKNIEIRVSGLKSAIESMDDLKPVCSIDLSGKGSGIHSFKLTRKHIRLPDQIKLTRISPDSITMKIDRKIQKNLPVVISLSGKLPAGFLLKDAKATPEAVIIQGPEKTLAPLEKIYTKPIDLKGITESIKKEITLELPEELTAAAPITTVTGEILIEEKIVTRHFPNLPLTGKGTQHSFEITPPNINIEVKGPVNILDRLQSENSLKPFIELNGLQPGVYVRRAVIILPVKTTLISVTPEVFTVKISHENQQRAKKKSIKKGE